jgi:hypothetical protein
MTLDEFIKKYSDKPADFDGYYGTQCMDLMHFYVYDILGIKDKAVLAAPSAHLAYKNFRWQNFFEKINNTPKGVPKKGDIMFWNTKIGEWGHTAIFIEGDDKKFVSFDANWPIGSLPHLQEHDYVGVAGWLRPKGVMDDNAKRMNWKKPTQIIRKLCRSPYKVKIN